MATAIKAPKLFTVKFELTGDADMDLEPWNVIAPDGDHEAGFETEAEAATCCADCNETLLADAEAEEEAERDELVRGIQDHVGEMSLKELRRLAKKLGVS